MEPNFTILSTLDNSNTLKNSVIDEHYHSTNGAITESKHVFIASAYEKSISQKSLHVLEIGFGTGLNCLLTQQKAEELHLHTYYYGIEKFPVPFDIIQLLNYSQQLNTLNEPFELIHKAQWGCNVNISEYFTITKLQTDLTELQIPNIGFDVVYFDAFSPDIQPEMWAEPVFKAIFESMNSQGILTTYCAKGEVRRTLQRVGFKVERLPGPPGKREMIRATKNTL